MKQSAEKEFTILYVEDQPELQELVQYILTCRPNIKFLGAMTAKQGLEMARQYKPDLVLMDIQLPDGDGFSTTKEMKSFQETKDIPVVGVTSLTKEQHIAHGLEIGFKYYVTKPIDVPEFLETIDRILDTSD